ncbi:DVU_1555 family C-GCAxxG-C-C protein [Thermodesulfobacteriota bacterium]
MQNTCRFDVKGLNTEQMRMIQRAQQGFHCSEILLFAGLEAQGKTNPDLIKAVSALAGGVGFSGEACGALTGGACLMGLYAGGGSEDEETYERFNFMINELVDWFSEKYGQEYGGIRCSEITEDNPALSPQRCPRIVAGVLKRTKEILQENGIPWEQEPFSPGREPEIVGDQVLTTIDAPQSACPCSAGAR